MQDLGREIDSSEERILKFQYEFLWLTEKKVSTRRSSRPKQHIELQTLYLDKISTYLYKNLTPVALRFKI